MTKRLRVFLSFLLLVATFGLASGLARSGARAQLPFVAVAATSSASDHERTDGAEDNAPPDSEAEDADDGELDEEATLRAPLALLPSDASDLHPSPPSRAPPAAASPAEPRPPRAS